MKTALRIFPLAAWIASLAAGQTTGPVRLSEPVEFPSVGLRLALPVAAARGAPGDPAGLWVAYDKDDPPRDPTILYAYPFYDRLQRPSLKEWAERAAGVYDPTGRGEPKKVVLSSQEVRVGALAGWRVVVRSPAWENPRVEAWTVFAVERPELKLTFYHPLGVIRSGGDPAPATAAAEAICRTVTTMPARSPAEIPLGALTVPVDCPEHGFRLSLPAGWFAQRADASENRSAVLRAGIADHTRRKELPYLSVAVRAGELKEGQITSDAYAKGIVAHLERQLWKSKWTLIHTRTAKLGDSDALEIASHFEQDGPQYCQVQRQVFRRGRFYTIAIMYPGSDAKAALAAMEQLAKAFRFLDAPTTQPASAE